MIPVWPASLHQTPRRNNWTGGPRDERVSFAPDRGPPIDRIGSTAQTYDYSVQFPNFSTVQRAEFIRWFKDDLSQGVKWFAWRDPVTLDVALWKIIGEQQAFSFNAKGAGWHDLSLRLLRRSFLPWWAPYCGSVAALRPPFVVADYAGGIYGVDLIRTPASAVAAVSGTFDVYKFNPSLGTTTIELAKVIAPGGIPATAPVGFNRIIALPVL